MPLDLHGRNFGTHNVAKAEEEREADDGPHDHGDSPDDTGWFVRSLVRRVVSFGSHQAPPLGRSIWKLPWITSMPPEIRWSDAGSSVWQ
jgi:hypothetical protein